MNGMTWYGAIWWEIVRWVVVILGAIPGIFGELIRFIFLRWFMAEAKGYFRIQERVLLEYPGGLTMGKGAGFNAGCWINAKGGITIGDNTICGPYCVIHSANHRSDRLDIPINAQGFDLAPVKIGNNVWLGARVTVLPGVTIGDNVIVGAGAVVTKDIPENGVAMGVPAVVKRFRTLTPLTPDPSPSEQGDGS